MREDEEEEEEEVVVEEEEEEKHLNTPLLRAVCAAVP
jgi:hypothetical protein